MYYSSLRLCFLIGIGFFYLISSESTAAELDYFWAKTISIKNPDSATLAGRGVLSTNDGGYLYAGIAEFRNPTQFGKSQGILVTRMSARGEVIWSKLFGGRGSMVLDNNQLPFVKTKDGHYVFLCRRDFKPSGSDEYQWGTWVVKIDLSGNFVWQKLYKNKFYGTPSTLVSSPDGGALVSGIDYNSEYKEPRVWSMKLNADGVIQWTKKYSSNLGDFKSIAATTDGGYLALGSLYQSMRFAIVKLDAGGSVLWTRSYENTPNSSMSLQALIEMGDGGFIVAGISEEIAPQNFQTQSDYLVMKLDHRGNIHWKKTFGRPGDNQEMATAVAKSPDGNLIVSGWTTAYGKNLVWNEIGILKITIHGNILWQKRYGTQYDDYSYNVVPISQGGNTGYVVAASVARSYGTLLALKEDGTIPKVGSAFTVKTASFVARTGQITESENDTVSVMGDCAISVFDGDEDRIDLSLEVTTLGTR